MLAAISRALQIRLKACCSLGRDLAIPELLKDMDKVLERVTVGSTNPIKIAAVRSIVTRLAPGAIITGVKVPSGVSDQPFSDEVTQAGARRRANEALVRGDGTHGIGIEGGVVVMPDGAMRTCAWCVVVDRVGREGMGGSLSMPLPELVANEIRAGKELADAMDSVAGVSGTKHGGGAVAILTNGLFNRQSAYEPMIAYALVPWIATGFFERKT